MDGAFYGLNGCGIYGLNGCGIYGLNGCGIYGLNGCGIYDLNGWGTFMAQMDGAVSYCFLGDMLKKIYWSSGEYPFQSLHDRGFRSL